jgi:hypothetical protein
MSLITITVSSITYCATYLDYISSWKVKTHLSAASSNFTAILPIALIDFLANVTSTSEA